MPEQTKINISPMLELLNKDMDMYSDLFNKVNSLQWSEVFRKEETIADLTTIRTALGLDNKIPKTRNEFSRSVGECCKKIMNETKLIRKEITRVLESITKDSFIFPSSSQETVTKEKDITEI